MHIKNIFIFLGLFLLNKEALYPQTGSPFSAALKEKIVTLLRENKVPMAAVGIIRDNKILGAKIFSDSIAVGSSSDLLFSVASLTKPVTMMLILTLVSKGLWKLDEPLANYWIDPDVKDDTLVYKLTSRHVLSHQGGFVNWRSMNPGGKLIFDTVPGTRFKYSGEGFEYLRRAIEHKFNKSFVELVEKYLFKPLGMKHSYLYWNTNIDSLRYAGRYDDNGNRYPIEKSMTANSAASLITTIEDYTKFGLACLDGVGLSADFNKQMQTPQIMVPQGDRVGIGLAWVIVNQLKNEEFALMHSGSDPGIKTLIVLLPRSKSGVVIFTNGDNGKKVYEEILRETLEVGEEILTRMTKK